MAESKKAAGKSQQIGGQQLNGVQNSRGRLLRAGIVVLFVLGAFAYLALNGTFGGITPSDAAGTWVGTYNRMDIGSPACSYTGNATLVLTQEGDNVTGSVTLGDWTITKGSDDAEVPCISADYMIHYYTVSGVARSPEIVLRDSYGENTTGNFTSDLMTLHETGMVSTETGVGCSAYCGSTWTFELTRRTNFLS